MDGFFPKATTTTQNPAPTPGAPNTNLGEISETAANIVSRVKEGVESVRDTVEKSVEGFSQSAEVGAEATSSFLNSNSILARMLFVLAVVIGFSFVFYTMSYLLLRFFNQRKSSIYLVKGIAPGNLHLSISQDSSQTNAAYVQRSNDQNSGLEFTWSIWLNINGLDSLCNHVFSKGVTSFNAETNLFNINGPGLYVKKDGTDTTGNTANLLVLMDQENSAAATDPKLQSEVKTIPLRKWVHVALRMKNTVLDVYINGTVASRIALSGVPKQNYENVLVGYNNGFSGQLSNLSYYSYALTLFDLERIVSLGPNLSQSAEAGSALGYYTYLSNQWYTSKF
jgi:hypothetical protein